MRLIMDLEVGRIEDMGFGYKLSANGSVISPKTTDVVYQKKHGISDITYKKRDDEMYDRDKGVLMVAPDKMSLELPKANSYDVGYLFGKNESLNMTYSHVQGKKDDMDSLLRKILGKNDEQAVLSNGIDEKSKEAAELDKEASELEYQAKMNEMYSKAISCVWGALSALGVGVGVTILGGMIGISGIVTALGAGIGAFIAGGSAVYVVLEWFTGAPQLHAAGKKLEADKIKAEVQSMRDKQSRISTEISVDQNRFSILSQSYSVFISIMQTIISAFNDARRAVTANMR